eukprot:gene841-2498_t
MLAALRQAWKVRVHSSEVPLRESLLKSLLAHCKHDGGWRSGRVIPTQAPATVPEGHGVRARRGADGWRTAID